MAVIAWVPNLAERPLLHAIGREGPSWTAFRDRAHRFADEGAARTYLEHRKPGWLAMMAAEGMPFGFRSFDECPERVACRPQAKEPPDLWRRLGERVISAAEHLDARERIVLEVRLLREKEERASLAELGQRFGCSLERARQIEVRTRRKLRDRLVPFSVSMRAQPPALGGQP